VTWTLWVAPDEKHCHPSTGQHMISQCMSDIWENCKEWLGSAPPPTIQSRLDPSDYHQFRVFKDHKSPALQEQWQSSGNHV
jgi:hypothetical protein